MKRIAEIFRLASVQEGVHHYYYGNAIAKIVDIYDPITKSYKHVGDITLFPFLAVLGTEKTVNIQDQTETYTISLCYGNLPDNALSDACRIFEENEKRILKILSTAKEISEQPHTRLFFSYEPEITFSYDILQTPTKFFMTSCYITLITK